MKAILEFDLSDRDEEKKFLRAMLADDLVDYIYDLAQELRAIEKYGPEKNIQEIRDLFYGLQTAAVQTALDSWE